jgi:hypothetical protein
MSAKEELQQIEKVLKNMARLVKLRAKKHNVALVYAIDGKIVSEKVQNHIDKK